MTSEKQRIPLMKPEQMRVKIAMACGWKIESTVAAGGWKLCCGTVSESFWWNQEKIPTLSDVSHQLPDYLNDLNAMHEAEKIICGKWRDIYTEKLEFLIRGCICKEAWPDHSVFQVAHATAPQRAEAFLKTIGKWCWAE